MGKYKSKTKKKNEDFKKKRVKVGKRLPKSDNFTDTSFKTRTIEVLQHIRTKDPSLPTTKRNLSITDLLSQCQHYNSSIRRDGVNGLRELLSDHPELLADNLSQLLQRTAELFTDKEDSVRQANLRLLRVILPLVSENVLHPFFPLLSAHLCCAMTHIDEACQRHSLFVLDLLLRHFPKQLVQNSGQLLPNFIQQISLLRDSKGGAKFPGKSSRNSGLESGTARSLTSDPNSKLSSVKWRMKVVQQLSRVLEVIIAEEGGLALSGVNGLINNSFIANTGHNSVSNKTGVVIQWTEYEQDQRVILQLNDLFRIKKDTSSSGQHLVRDKVHVQKFIKTLIPLVLDCWVECSPEVKWSCIETPVSIEFLPVLASMAELLKLICQYTDLSVQAGNLQMRGWLAKTYGAELIQRIMAVFPYSTYTYEDGSIAEKSSKYQANFKVKNAQNNLALEKQLNLNVCFVLSYLVTDSRDGPLCKASKSLALVIHYMESLLQKYQVKRTLMQLFVHITVRILSAEGDFKILHPLVKSMLHSYNTVNPFSTEKVILIDFFLHLVEKHSNEVLCDLIDQFLSTLPALLVQMVSHSTQRTPAAVNPILRAIKRAACQRQSSLQQQLQAELITIFSLIPSVEPVLQHDLLEIVYRLEHFTDKQLNKMVLLSRTPEVSLENIAYVLEILQHRLIRLVAPSNETNQYFTLLFSTALGRSQKELTLFQIQSNPNEVLGVEKRQGPVVLFSAEPTTTSRHSDIVKIVCSLLARWPNTSQIQMVMDRFLSDLLERYPLLTEETALGLVSIGHTVNIEELYMSQVGGYLTHLCHNMLHQLKYMKDTTEGVWARTTLRDELWYSAITFLKLSTHAVSQLLAEGI